MKHFSDMVQEQLTQDRKLLVIDNLHGCARIEERIRCFWNALASGTATREDIQIILVGIASIAQHVAESLHFADEQEEVSIQSEPFKQKLKDLLELIGHNSKQIPSLQIGHKRFSFEFDEDLFHILAQRVDE